MKKNMGQITKYIISFGLFFSAFFVMTLQVNAAATLSPTTAPSITPTPAAESQAVLQQIDNLKEKVASKVASLHLVQKRGIIGKITDVNSTLITINDVQNNTRFIDVDEITKFYDASGTAIGVSDLQKNTTISAFGLYNKDSQHLLARYINVVTNPTYLSGEIASINRTSGTFYMTSADGKQHNIDVETFTKSDNYTKSTDLTKIGFSKIAVGDRVIIIGYPDKTDSSLTVASRILQFTDVAKLPNVNIAVSPTISTATIAPTTITKPTTAVKKTTTVPQ